MVPGKNGELFFPTFSSSPLCPLPAPLYFSLWQDMRMGRRGKIAGKRYINSNPTTSLIFPLPDLDSKLLPQSPDFYTSSKFLSPATCGFATPVTSGTVDPIP